MTSTKICKNCGKEFSYSRSDKNYCSKKCYHSIYFKENYIHKLPYPPKEFISEEKTCKNCGTKFITTTTHKVYCSQNCNWTGFNKSDLNSNHWKSDEKNCLYCNIPIQRTKNNWRTWSTIQFCSPKHNVYYKRWGTKEQHMKLYSDRKCLQCGIIFSQNYGPNIGGMKKFCSQSCNEKSKNIKATRSGKRIAWYHKNLDERRTYGREKAREKVAKEIGHLEKAGIRFKGGNTRIRCINQAKMFYIVSQLFPNDKPIRNDRLTLGGLELDVYFPSLKLAFEYMGQYHYIFNTNNPWPLKTIEEFEALKWRDQRKRELCKEKGIILIDVKYEEEVTPELILDKLKKSEALTKQVE